MKWKQHDASQYDSDPNNVATTWQMIIRCGSMAVLLTLGQPFLWDSLLQACSGTMLMAALLTWQSC